MKPSLLIFTLVFTLALGVYNVSAESAIPCDRDIYDLGLYTQDGSFIGIGFTKELIEDILDENVDLPELRSKRGQAVYLSGTLMIYYNHQNRATQIIGSGLNYSTKRVRSGMSILEAREVLGKNSHGYGLDDETITGEKIYLKNESEVFTLPYIWTMPEDDLISNSVDVERIVTTSYNAHNGVITNISIASAIGRKGEFDADQFDTVEVEYLKEVDREI